MGKVKYDLKASKDSIGPLYPRLLDNEGREIDGFHREDADSDWPTTKLEHIDTDVKYWTARIVANAHRRSISKEERKEDLTELAKALIAEGHEGNLIKSISELTTFSERYIYDRLPDTFKKRPGVGGPSGVELSSTSEQKSKRKTKWDTTDKEKRENLYKKVEKSAFTGQKPTSQSLIDEAKEFGLDVKQYEETIDKIKETLRASVGRRYEDVKDLLTEAYNSSKEMKKTLKRQIKAEEERVKKANEEMEEKLRKEVKNEVKKEVIEMTEKERMEKLLEDIPEELRELREWVRDGFWGIEKIKAIINNPTSRERMTSLLEKAPEKLLENVRKGKTSLVYAYTSIKRAEKHISPPLLPEGLFDVIYADPPWPYYLPLRGAPDAHYNTKSIEDICNLEVEGVSIQEKIADDSILFLWATNPQLKAALEVIESWGFDYKTNMVWVKDKWGTGYYFRGQHELLLLAIKGDIPPPIEEVRKSSILQSPVHEHSKKPDEVYEYIEVMYPNRRYLELFARNQRENWTSWGLEI